MRILNNRYTHVGILILALAIISTGQNSVTVTGNPERDFNYECKTVPTSPPGPQFTMRFVQFPFQSLQTSIALSSPAASADTTPPVITAVGYSGTPVRSVLGNNVKLDLSNGVPLTVSATDDSAVMYYRLLIDDKPGPQEGNGVDAFGGTFYIRWNTALVTPGIHTFKLLVYDAAFNPAERDWTMTR